MVKHFGKTLFKIFQVPANLVRLTNAALPSPNSMPVVTEVCHFGHIWLSHGRCAMTGSSLGILLGLSWRQTDKDTSSKNIPSLMFWGVYGSSTMPGTPSGCLVGLS